MVPNEDRKTILEPLQTAIRLEEEGRQFFQEAAQRVGTGIARKTLEFLAEEETNHIRRIREYYHTLAETTESVDPGVDESDADRRFAGFQERLALLKDEVEPTASDLEAYRTALKFENGAEDFYREKMNETDDAHIRTFYRWLINEEEMHARVLQSCIEFVENPAEWFRKHEKRDE